VAAHAQDQEPIRAALNRKGASPSAVLRNLRCPFIRADLVNEHVRGATSFQMERTTWNTSPPWLRLHATRHIRRPRRAGSGDAAAPALSPPT
jgi:hypothetical protein